MSNQKETFAGLMHSFGYRYDPRTVFDDFLTMSICAVSQNPGTGKSYYEDIYLSTVLPYKDDSLRYNFPKMFGCLVDEMDDRVNSDTGNDVLGEFYEQNFSRKNSGQIFTPWHICKFMAEITVSEARKEDNERSLRIIDPACGSGRMILAAAKANSPRDEYYGIDIDSTCVKMTALNLFLNGIFHSEVLCADALMPEDFRFSYRLSFAPLGIFKIEEKGKSPLWHMLKESLSKPAPENDIKLPSELRKGQPNTAQGSQLQIF